MTFLGQETAQESIFEVGIRDRLRIARENAYPGMEKIEFSTNVLRMGKNIATAYESKTGTGTREENMKDMVLQTWADKCHVTFEALKYGEGVVHLGPHPGPSGDTPRKITFVYIASTPENVTFADFGARSRAAA